MTLAHRLGAVLLVLCLGLLTACSGQGPSGSPDAGPTTEAPSPSLTTSAAPATADSDQETVTAEAAQTTQQPETTQEPKKKKKDTAQGAPLPDGTITALLVGTDSRSGDLGGMSDVIVVVQLSADRKNLHLVSVARDSYVDIPGYGRSKINDAFARGGIPLLRQTVSDLLGGLEIDLVAQTNFDMFIALTRWMDGFYVDNTHATTVTVGSTGRQVVFEEGRILLENTDGLIYVRERKTLPLGDLDRTQRHRAALVGMMERLVEIREEEPARLVELLPMLYKNVKLDGDLEVDHLLTMVAIGARLDEDAITSLMVPVSHFGTAPGGASVNILDDGRVRELGTALRKGDLSGYVDRHGTSYAPTGG